MDEEVFIMNLVVLSGFLTKDAELKKVGEREKISFTVASNEVYFSNKEKKEKVNFINVAYWGTNLEKIAAVLKKATHVELSGRLDITSTKDDKGVYHNYHEVTASKINFLGNKKEGDKKESVQENIADETTPF